MGFKRIDQLDPNGCKFGVDHDADGYHMFCNRPRGRHPSYCPEHADLTIGIGTRSEREAMRQGLKFARMET